METLAPAMEALGPGSAADAASTAQRLDEKLICASVGRTCVEVRCGPFDNVKHGLTARRAARLRKCG
eukprot:360663-Chlamydomonas_euryale.AAC.13